MKIGRNLQSIIMAGVLVLGFFLFSFAVFYPALSKMVQKKKELIEKRQKADNINKTIVNGMNQFRKEMENLKKENETLDVRLPMNSSFPELLNQISKETEKLDVQIMTINRLEEKQDDELKILRLPMIIDLVADYKTLFEYLKALHNIQIAVNIKRLVIVRDEKNVPPPKLRVNIEMETYISLVD
jgi:Tfp pilus assembly protein PilO